MVHADGVGLIDQEDEVEWRRALLSRLQCNSTNTSRIDQIKAGVLRSVRYLSDTVPIRIRTWTLRPSAILHRLLPYIPYHP